MTPKEMSAALKKIAAKLEASKKPSKEMVLKDINQVILAASKEEAKAGKVGQSDKNVAAYKQAFEQCSAEMKAAQEKFSECWASHDYSGAAEACTAMAECSNKMADNKKGNEHVHEMLTSAMKGSHKASTQKTSSK